MATKESADRRDGGDGRLLHAELGQPKHLANPRGRRSKRTRSKQSHALETRPRKMSAATRPNVATSAAGTLWSKSGATRVQVRAKPLERRHSRQRIKDTDRSWRATSCCAFLQRQTDAPQKWADATGRKDRDSCPTDEPRPSIRPPVGSPPTPARSSGWPRLRPTHPASKRQMSPQRRHRAPLGNVPGFSAQSSSHVPPASSNTPAS